jgi:DNA-binding FrmR family transcriptional regulator
MRRRSPLYRSIQEAAMTGPSSDSSHGNTRDDEHRRILNRLKRLEGQIRGLQSMIEAGKDCDAVLTQVMAAKSALNQVGLLLIGNAMRDCLARSDATSKEEVTEEALGMLMRFVNLPEMPPTSLHS